MPRVLIITYYWPPSGGSAVLRWLKFVKYFREFNWEPVVYTPSNPEPQEIDYSLLKDIPENLEVITSPIREPYNIYKWLTGRKKMDRLGVALMTDRKNNRFIDKIFLWIRSNLFIPDPRKFWTGPSVRLLSKYLDRHPVDVVVTTGPPHSMHLIGLHLKRRLGVKWLADFRDPWTNIDFYQDLALSKWADRCHHRLERTVLETADQVVTVSPGMTKEFGSMGILHVATITNGYDTEAAYTTAEDSGKFTLLHLGSLPKSRNPENLWKVLSELVMQNAALEACLQIRLIGKTDHSVMDSIRYYQLEHYVKQEEYIPHNLVQGILCNTSVLLLCINQTANAKGILTNKFFEYLSAHRPILAFGPTDGDVSAILANTGAGRIFHYDNTVELKDHLCHLFELYVSHDLKTDSGNLEKVSRKNLTGELSVLLNKIIL